MPATSTSAAQRSRAATTDQPSEHTVPPLREIDPTPRRERAAWPRITTAVEAQAALTFLRGLHPEQGDSMADLGWSIDAERELILINTSGDRDSDLYPVAGLSWREFSGPSAATTVSAAMQSDDCVRDVPLWYEILPSGRAGEPLYIVGSEIQVVALHFAGFRAACLPTCMPFEIGPLHVLALRQLLQVPKTIVIADAGVVGERRGLTLAAALTRLGYPVELRTWPDGTIDGYTIADEVVRCEHKWIPVGDALDQLPGMAIPLAPPEGLRWPADPHYAFPPTHVGGNGVYEIVTDRKTGTQSLRQIVPFLTWLGKRYRNAAGGDAAVELCADIDGRTVRKVVAMSEIGAAPHIPQLADHGFLGLTSDNANAVVKYLGAALAANIRTLPVAQTARTVGTEYAPHETTPMAFVHNGVRRLPDGAVEPVELSPTAGIEPRRWSAYRTHGSALEWAKLVRAYREHRFFTPFTMLCAAVASLLNRPLRLMPMSVQLAGESSGGKTTALEHAASTFGDPESIVSMRATDNAMEKNLAFAHDLPLCLDELQSYAPGPKQHKALEALVYMISERQGKDRLRRDLSQRETATWSCNALMTGEMDLGELQSTGNTGSRRRVISFFGTPFGERSKAVAAILRELNDLVADNYGHAIPAVAARLLDLDDAGWAALRARHRAILRRYLDEQTPAGVDVGLAETGASAFAAFELAGELLARCFPTAFANADGTPDGLSTTAEMLAGPWQQTVKRYGGAMRAERALDALRSFLALRRGDFDGGDPVSPDVPRTVQKVGRFGTYNGVRYVAFVPEPLAEYLTRAGLDYDTDRKHWLERGWVVCDGAGKSTLAVRINGSKVRCLAIKRDVLEGLDDAASSPVEHGNPAAPTSSSATTSAPAATVVQAAPADGSGTTDARSDEELELDLDRLPF